MDSLNRIVQILDKTTAPMAAESVGQLQREQ